MKRTLSVPSLKLLFLTRMLGGSLGTGVALYVLARLHSLGVNRELVVALAVVQVLILSALIVKDWRTWGRLKQVAVDDRFLYVSDYPTSVEVAVPLSDIVRVTQRRGKMIRPATLYLRSPSQFGEHIQFQPIVEKGETGWAWQENRVVEELRTLANVQTGKEVGRRRV
jgi:hypothetical protein